VSRARRYWPTASVSDRIELLLAEFKAIEEALSKVIAHIGLNLPSTHCITTLNRLKRYEDVIDALVSGWVEIRYVEGRAIPHGDRTAAIWCPC
jgi:hypothetical protein